MGNVRWGWEMEKWAMRNDYIPSDPLATTARATHVALR